MGDYAVFSGAIAAVLVASVGGLVRVNSTKFRDLSEKIDSVLARVDDISEKNQSRHEENVQRLTRLETIANANGYNGARRKRP